MLLQEKHHYRPESRGLFQEVDFVETEYVECDLRKTIWVFSFRKWGYLTPKQEGSIEKLR